MAPKIMTVMGTRPEAIKLAPIVRELESRSPDVDSIVCSTGQHREMLDQVFDVFEIRPHHDLQVMAPGQTLAQVTSRVVSGLDEVIAREGPDLVIVQGDTTSAFCGALAAFYRRLPVGHVEAGLRTGDKWRPFPEEMNRCLVGRLADLHFAPTRQARETLLQEGVPAHHVFQTGNTVIDALLWVRDQVIVEPPLLPDGLLEDVNDAPLVLITGHRRESFGGGFENICHAIRDVAESFPETRFVYPVHLNPQVREPVHRILGGLPGVHLIEPLTYRPFVWLMNRALVILTDSGGVQEEAPSLGKPVLVMRETTERPEGVESGNAKLVGVDRDQIVSELSRLLESESARNEMTRAANPYGDGSAARQIVDHVMQRIGRFSATK